MKESESISQHKMIPNRLPQQGATPNTHAHKVEREPARRTFLKRITLAMGGIAAGAPAFAESSTPPTTDKNPTEEINDIKEVLFSPPGHDYASLTPERREAILQPRIMHVVIVTTEEATAEATRLGGDILAGTQKIAKSTEEFFTNSGADVEFAVQTTVITIPRSEYADDSDAYGGTEAQDYMDTNLTKGSFLDTEFQRIADANGIPRDKICPFLYIKNTQGKNIGGGAFTNFGAPGIVLEAESALQPNMNDRWQREVGPHEFTKKFISEHPNDVEGSLLHSFRWEVPTDDEGNLLYDFREKADDPLPIKEIVTPAYTTEPCRRQILHTSCNGKNVQLYDYKSGAYIDIPIGDENCDAWHNGSWDITLDKYTHNRETDTQAPELLSENGLAPMGVLPENDTTFDLEMNFNEDVVVGTGMIYLSGTYKGPDGNESGIRNYTFPASDLVIDGSKASLPVKIDKFTHCFVTMDEGVLLDTSGNAFAGISDESWWFETRDFSTDIDEMEKPEFKVSPNPFVDHINISNAQKLGRVEIVNIQGQVIDRISDPQEYVSLNHLNLKSDIHFVRLFDRNGQLVKNEKMMKR